MTEHEFKLADNAQGHEHQPYLRGKVVLTDRGIDIFFEGYGQNGMAEGHGSPIYIELYEGKPKLMVWADINNEEPTRVIDLSGAKESKREPDDLPCPKCGKRNTFFLGDGEAECHDCGDTFKVKK